MARGCKQEDTVAVALPVSWHNLIAYLLIAAGIGGDLLLLALILATYADRREEIRRVVFDGIRDNIALKELRGVARDDALAQLAEGTPSLSRWVDEFRLAVASKPARARSGG